MDSLLVTCNPIFRILTICIPRRQNNNREWQHERINKQIITPPDIPVPEIVPSSSTTFHVQPNLEQQDPLVTNLGKLHFRLDYDFVTNKVINFIKIVTSCLIT